jgi:hypothetical protein
MHDGDTTTNDHHPDTPGPRVSGRTPDLSDMKLIAFSVWGAAPKYTAGAVRNAELARFLYPDWSAIFFCQKDVDRSIQAAILERGGIVRIVDEAPNWRGTVWRFFATWIPGAEAIIFRDTDSRLGTREQAAVAEWLRSDHAYHIMRDHPDHLAPMLGGMWGVKGNGIQTVRRELGRIEVAHPEWGLDQDFLAHRICPHALNDALIHDEFFSLNDFPTARIGTEFVGDVFDENDARHPEHWKSIACWNRLRRNPILGRRLRTARSADLTNRHLTQAWLQRQRQPSK